jgi:ketosteroid isomerase-like protein
MVKQRNLIPSLLLCGILIGSIAVAADTRTFEASDPGNKYTAVPQEALDVIAAGEAAFAKQDAVASGTFLTEDYSWYHITEDGPKQMISGREQTVELLKALFKDDSWQESEVHRLGMLDNILVQVEIDTLASETGTELRRSITIYEFKDGKRWREWKFYPSAETSW